MKFLLFSVIQRFLNTSEGDSGPYHTWYTAGNGTGRRPGPPRQRSRYPRGPGGRRLHVKADVETFMRARAKAKKG